MKKLLYIGWLGKNNIGDELMWDIFIDMCDRYGVSQKYEIIPNSKDSNLNNLVNYDAVVLGGGSLLLPGYIEWLYTAYKAGAKIFIWGSGYDWAEKDYIQSLMNENTPAYLFPDDTEIMLEELIPNCEFVGVRGPLTYNLLKKSFLNPDDFIQSGDPGFALKEQPLESYMPITTINSNERIIGINWGSSFNNIYGRNEEHVSDELARVCNYLIDNGYTLYLYIMWDKDLNTFLEFYKKIKPSKNVIIDTNVYSGGQLLSVLKKCYFTINFKLHGNITSATANTPFICLGYRFKCFDMAKSLGCDNLIVSTDAKDIYSELIQCIKYLTENYDDVKTTLNKYVTEYKANVELPFSRDLF